MVNGELVTKIANTMDVSEAEVRVAFDNLIKPQSYVPIQGLSKYELGAFYGIYITEKPRINLKTR